MRVLWFTNIPMPAVDRRTGRPTFGSGHWMKVLLEALRSRGGLELGVVTAYPRLPDLEFEEGDNRFRYQSGEQAWNLWVNHYGPARSLAATLDDARREELKRDMIAWHETFASPLGYDQPRRYVVTRAVRK